MLGAIYCNAKYLKDLKPRFNSITVVSAEAVFFLISTIAVVFGHFVIKHIYVRHVSRN